MALTERKRPKGAGILPGTDLTGTPAPFLLRTDPPEVLTWEQIEQYFRERGTMVTITHIPATHPRSEDGA